jgi:hypothetical protein
MVVKSENKIINVTLTPWHIRKLAMIKERTGLSTTGVVQRFIERHEMFQLFGEKKEKAPPG